MITRRCIATGAVADARRQIVKNGFFAGRSAAGVFGLIQPIVTPRSPLDATITRSGAQLTGLWPAPYPSPTIRPIASDPSTTIRSSGLPRLIASALPNVTNAGPMPIFCASSENERSARSRLAFAVAIASALVAGSTIAAGSAGAIGAIVSGAALARARL